jgi:hypothetical protein
LQERQRVKKILPRVHGPQKNILRPSAQRQHAPWQSKFADQPLFYADLCAALLIRQRLHPIFARTSTRAAHLFFRPARGLIVQLSRPGQVHYR